jgi:hypothetical protein
MPSSRPLDAQAAAKLGFFITGLVILIFSALPGLVILLGNYRRFSPDAPSDLFVLLGASWGVSTVLAVGLMVFAGRLARWLFPDCADDPAAPPATLVALQAGLAPALVIIGAVLLTMAVPDLLYYLVRASRGEGSWGNAPEDWLRCLAQFLIGLSFFVFPRSITRLVHQLHGLASEKSPD